MPENNPAVVFIFINERGELLLEQRPSTSSYSGELIFPGGMVEDNELNDLQLTLVREAYEEFEVRPIFFHPLDPITSETNRLLYPFVITGWKGKISEHVLDKYSKLVWLNFTTAITSKFQSVRILSQATKRFIEENYDTSLT